MSESMAETRYEEYLEKKIDDLRDENDSLKDALDNSYKKNEELSLKISLIERFLAKMDYSIYFYKNNNDVLQCNIYKE